MLANAKENLGKLPEEDGGRSPGRAAGATADLHFVHQSARKTTLHKRLVHNIGAQKTGARHNNLCSAPGPGTYSKDSRATLVQTEVVFKKLVCSRIGA